MRREIGRVLRFLVRGRVSLVYYDQRWTGVGKQTTVSLSSSSSQLSARASGPLLVILPACALAIISIRGKDQRPQGRDFPREKTTWADSTYAKTAQAMTRCP